MKAVKGVIVRLKGQATSCCCAGQPPFVRGAKTERTPDPGGDDSLPLPLSERGAGPFHRPAAFQKAAQSRQRIALSLP